MNKTILITGGTGSWGGELISQLLTYHQPQEIRIFSRNEALQVTMKQQLNDPRLTFIIGDIRDKQEITQACQGVDVVYHLAALKHVPLCENQPDTALKTNVIGTQHVIEAAIEQRVQKVIYVSTDKASNPSSTYGITKAIGEKLIIHANARDAHTRFVSVRSGNVLGSTGSVADVVVSRAGSNSIHGLLMLHKPMLLISHASGGARTGQILNAENFQQAGYAKMLLEAHLPDENFMESLFDVYQHREAYIGRMKSREAEEASAVNMIMALIKETVEKNSRHEA